MGIHTGPEHHTIEDGSFAAATYTLPVLQYYPARGRAEPIRYVEEAEGEGAAGQARPWCRAEPIRCLACCFWQGLWGGTRGMGFGHVAVEGAVAGLLGVWSVCAWGGAWAGHNVHGHMRP